MILSDVAIRNRTTIFVMVFLIAVAGTISYLTLPREAAPDVPIPYVLVTTSYEGVAPQDVETSVTMKIEKELSGLKGLKEMSSSSAEGVSTIVAEFLPDVRIEDALQRVRDKVDLARSDLPDEADEPVIREINVAEFPVMMLSISGNVSPVRLKVIADELEDLIEQVPGVLNVDVLGGLEREIRLEIDPDRVATYGLTIPELLTLIPSENVNVSAGGLETPVVKFNVRVPGEFDEPVDIEHLLLTIRDGKPVYLADVATVRDTFKDRDSYARLDGADSITVSIQKRIGANIQVLAGVVKAIVRDFSRQLPAGVKIEPTLDLSEDIGMMVSDLENNMVSGLILVVLVLMVFMGLRTSLIVALAIPLSMLISFAVLQAMGFTLNMIVLFSLILALGMLVDNAIVIVENIFRHRQLGYGRIEAAMKGTAEVAWPVITSTATTVAAFAPLVFWPGIMGEFMKYLPITLIVTLSSSLFVALVITPTVSALAAGGGGRKRSLDHPFLRGYRWVLQRAVGHGTTTLSLAAMLLVGLGIAYVKWGPGVTLFPEFDPRRAIVNIRSPQGTNIAESNRLAGVAEERIRPLQAELDHVITNVGSAGGFSLVGNSSGPHVGNLTLVFHEYEKRKRRSAKAVEEIRRRLAGIPGAEIKVEKEKEGPPTGAAVTVRLIGRDFGALENLSEVAKRRIADVPGLVNLRSDLEATRPELVFKVDRSRAMMLGVNSLIIGNFLKTAVFGSKVSTYRQFNDEYDITVRLPLSQRTDVQDLFRLRVPNVTGQAVPLSSLGNFEYRGGLGTISRINQKRVVTLTGDAEGRLGSEVLRDVQQRLEGLSLPAGYRVEYAGEREEQEKASQFLFMRALPFALLLIVMILVAQFNTLSVPVIIMSTVILSFIGVLVGLLATQLPFSVIMTGVGVISLAGVVVNNAIVLLDYTRQLQRRGMDLVSAALQAGQTRLRPVLLTAITTILGLIPMATGVSFDFHTFRLATRSETSQWWASLAIAVIFGLGFATLLTLLVVPTMYVMLYRLATRFGLGGLSRPAAETPAADTGLVDG